MNKQIKTVCASIYEEPKFSSELINQSLYLDSVLVVDSFKNWYLVDMYDGYRGWVHSFYLMDSMENNYDYHLINTKFSNNKSANLSFGTSLPIKDKLEGRIKSLNPISDNDWYSVKDFQFNNKRDEIIYYSNQLVGVPYLWGGRSSFGLDCSGFIQLVLKVANIPFPRDTFKQHKFNKLEEISLDCALPGDIVFFSDNEIVNHVGFYIGNYELIHSSGSVKIESFDSRKNNFSEKIKNMFYKVFSINKLISN